MPDEIDVAILTQDPRFGGGARAQTEAFWRASIALGRAPHLLYASRRRATSPLRRSLALAPAPETSEPFTGTAYPSFVPELDSLNQLVVGKRAASQASRSRSVWVVAASASYGYGAACSRRPFACWVGTGLADEWAARRAGLPRSRRVALGVNAPVLRRLEREVLRRAALVYATSDASRRSVASAGDLAPEAVGILPIPVDLDRFSPEPDASWCRRFDGPVIAFVGRAGDPRKNVGLLLRAFERVRARAPRTRLRLIGPPPDGGPPRRPDGVEVAGEVASVAPLLREATLFVLPSLQEGFGIVVAEALASGVPAVVTPCGGPEELVRRSGGGRVLSGFGADELADTVLELLGDPARLAEMRRRGRSYVAREHSPARFREQLAIAFEKLDAVA